MLFRSGGVIIKGGRITQAACMFPLSQRGDLPKSLGTRHRAAIGLTEETDAVVIVVSEETGMISCAYRGELRRGLRVEDLRAFLTSVFVKPVRTRRIWHWLRRRVKPRAARPEAPVAPEGTPAVPTPGEASPEGASGGGRA